MSTVCANANYYVIVLTSSDSCTKRKNDSWYFFQPDPCVHMRILWMSCSATFISDVKFLSMRVLPLSGTFLNQIYFSWADISRVNSHGYIVHRKFHFKTLQHFMFTYSWWNKIQGLLRDYKTRIFVCVNSSLVRRRINSRWLYSTVRLHKCFTMQ